MVMYLTAYKHVLQWKYPEFMTEQRLRLKFNNQEVIDSNPKMDR